MNEWPVKNLGDLLEVSIGGIWGSEAGEDEVDVFVYRSTELLKEGQLKEELTVRRSITARQLDSRKLEEGDLLLEKSGGGPKTPVGRVGLVKVLSGLSVCSNFMQLMRPRKKDVLPVYLHYFLNHFHVAGHTEDLQNNSTNIRNLKTTEYMEVEIPLPPMEEQKRLVALLDAATARVTELTAGYEQARTHANNLFASVLRDALESNPDWPVKTLGDVCELVSRGRPPSYCEGGGIVVLNQKCVRNGKIDFGPSRRTDDSAKVIPEWAYLCEGDTLINSTGAGTLGRASFISKLTELTTFDTHLTVVRPHKDLCWPAFVGLVLNGREKDIVDLAGGATGQTELPRESVRSFEIPVPPLEEQKRIVARLDAMRTKTSEMVAAYDSKLTAAKNLRQSILEAAFAGDL
jgi:type I restriction enzyme S subunit